MRERVSRRAVWLTVLGLAAASTPQAIAAEGVVDAALPPVPNATELTAAILEDASATSLTAPVATPPPSELPAAPAQIAAEEPVQVGADAAPPPEPVAEPVPEPEPEPEPDPEPEPVAPQPEPPAVQQEPTNVNVSVRVDSPGDDGAVTQVNVAVDDPQYQPDEPQYQPVVAPTEAPEPRTLPVSPVRDEQSADPDGGWDWTWNWSCGDAPVGDIAIPFGVGAQDWTWNWNWICGTDEPVGSNSVEESIAGYHEPVKQYRPVNINVSIRIGSPGDNGPVVQANVAVGVTIPPIPVLASIPAPAGLAAAPVQGAESSSQASAASSASPASVASSPADERDECCLLREPRGVAYDSASPVSVVLAARTTAPAPDTTFAERDTVAIAARIELRNRRAAAAAESPPRPQARPARPAATRPGLQDEERPIMIQGGLLGFDPISGPDRPWPYVVLMVFAFIFASLNISWVSAKSRPTPGIDADDPPTRPG